MTRAEMEVAAERKKAGNPLWVLRKKLTKISSLLSELKVKS